MRTSSRLICRTVLRIDLTDGGFIIVTPGDFVFDVPELHHVKIQGMLPLCPMTDLVKVLNDYGKHLTL